jgi:hydroxypyruvate isomerase
LGVKVINCTPGPAINGLERSVQYQTLIENLSYAAPLFEECGTRLLIEPINTFDQPGFFISNSKDGAKVVSDVSHRNFGLQYDVYHMQLMEGNIMNNIKKNIDIIGHFQIADVPGRLEPGKGEIGYSNIFKFIDDLGYEGFIGAEYKPENTTEEGLVWIKQYDGLEIA